jgi:hypothetical protein
MDTARQIGRSQPALPQLLDLLELRDDLQVKGVHGFDGLLRCHARSVAAGVRAALREV